MSKGQGIALDLILVVAFLALFISGKGRDLWRTLLGKQPQPSLELDPFKGVEQAIGSIHLPTPQVTVQAPGSGNKG